MVGVDTALINNLRTDYSFTIFLKDPSTYEGGVLEMKMQDGQVQQFKLPAGQMVLYPTGQLHRVTEVTSGSRRCIVGWMQSAFADSEDRALNAEFCELMNFAKEDLQLGWDDMNRFNQFKQKLVRRLLK